MSAYDPGPRRGRTVTAVLLAVALLAVLGAAFGYVAGVRHNDSKPVSDRSPGSVAGVPTPCPDFIQQQAGARGAALPMTQRLYVLTKKQNAGDGDPYRAEAWICAAANQSGLWYQGHAIKKGPYPDEQVVNDPQSGNGILISGANAVDGNKYRATYTDSNGSTTYTVSRKELTISGPAGTSIQTVVHSVG